MDEKVLQAQIAKLEEDLINAKGENESLRKTLELSEKEVLKQDSIITALTIGTKNTDAVKSLIDFANKAHPRIMDLDLSLNILIKMLVDRKIITQEEYEAEGEAMYKSMSAGGKDEERG